HEAGHFFGLAHATDAKSTMFASYKPGTTILRTLTQDDVAGICSIYPTAALRVVSPSTGQQEGTLPAGKCDPNPRHGLTTQCEEARPPQNSTSCSATAVPPEGRGGAFAAGFGVVAALAFARGRRRR